MFFWCNICNFLNLSIFVREYRTRRPGTSHSKERYVIIIIIIIITKPQTLHNTMQKTRPRYINWERFHWGFELGCQKLSPCIFKWFMIAMDLKVKMAPLISRSLIIGRWNCSFHSSKWCVKWKKLRIIPNPI